MALRLSILICTIPRHSKSLSALLTALTPQLTDEVEVLVESRTDLNVGAKRNILLKDAAGVTISTGGTLSDGTYGEVSVSTGNYTLLTSAAAIQGRSPTSHSHTLASLGVQAGDVLDGVSCFVLPTNSGAVVQVGGTTGVASTGTASSQSPIGSSSLVLTSSS